MIRRDFFVRSGLFAALARSAFALRPPDRPLYYDPSKLRRAGVASSSFLLRFASVGGSGVRRLARPPALLDLPQIIADRYLVEHVEFASSQFTSTEPQYLEELRRKLMQARSHLVNIAVRAPALDTGGGLSCRDEAQRRAAVQTMRQWIDAARRLSAEAVSSVPGPINSADIRPAIESYRELGAYGRLRRVRVLIENGPGAEAGDIVDVIRQSGGSVGSLPGMQAFTTPRDRTAGLELLFPHAFVLCHAPGVRFDAQGNETTFNFPACIEIAKRYRFRGIYCVTYDGAGDPYEGVQNVLNELIRYL